MGSASGCIAGLPAPDRGVPVPALLLRLLLVPSAMIHREQASKDALRMRIERYHAPRIHPSRNQRVRLLNSSSNASTFAQLLQYEDVDAYRAVIARSQVGRKEGREVKRVKYGGK